MSDAPGFQDDPEYEYVAYIDEAGDPGIRRVQPIDPNGASEWLALGAVVMRASQEPNVVEWVRDARQAIASTQGPDLHFRKLSDERKLRVCEHVAQMRLKGFVVISNKKNMRGYRNRAAEAYLGPKGWFYNYCVRLLLERLSDYCLRMSMRANKTPGKVKLIFSERGGVKYNWLNAYLRVLQIQSKEERLFLVKRSIRWEVIDPSLVEVVPHRLSAGAQIADVLTSAFYSAADALGPRWNVKPAMALLPCMATERGLHADYSVALQPSPPRRANLTEEQKQIFRFYGYVIE